MNILFVRKFPLIDGSFTLLIRLMEEFARKGHTCYFFQFDTNYDASLLERIHKSSVIITETDLKSHKTGKKILLVDKIFAQVRGDLLVWVFNILKQKYFPSAAVILGIFHPRAFVDKSIIGPTADDFFHRYFFKQLPARNIIIMNEVVLSEHKKHLKNQLAGANIIPLPVDICDNDRDYNKVDRNKIISIGRLVSFKNYIFHVASEIAYLNNNGYNFEYHIYGDGVLETKLRQEISRLKLTGKVFLHGTLAYEKMGEVLADKLMFIGMGTALVEAAAHRVPALIAVESNAIPTTYGWISETKGYHIGERVENVKEFPIRDFIIDIHEKSKIEYIGVAEKCRNKALDFSIRKIINEYEKVFENADSFFEFKFPAWKNFLLKLARQPYKLLRLKKYKDR